MNYMTPSPRVIFENSNVLVINKHAGHSFHRDLKVPAQRSGYFHKMREQLLDERPGVDLYPCNRLDLVTSGCMVLAKDASTARCLGNMFESRNEVRKTYIALSSRKPKKKMGRIVGDMVKGRRGSWKLTRETNNPAVTTFESHRYVRHEASSDHAVSSENISRNETPQITMYCFIVRPHTGRTHQVRVALKSIGSPILGDDRYGNAFDARLIDRTYLHSASVEFALPQDLGGERVAVECPPFGAEDAGVYFSDDSFRDLYRNIQIFKPI
jgi:tRNA pseudouridine32 synthase/23S rRNA pseudouridine746 synthase